jgi:hypothetical protein
MDAPPGPRPPPTWPDRLLGAQLAWPCVGLLGVLYAAFSLMLHRAGITARAVWLPIEPQRYYLAQAVFVVPLLAASCWLFVAIAWALSGARRAASLPRAFQLLGVTWALPVLVLFLVPDLAVYLVAGHAALAPAMRVYGPLAPLGIVVASALALRGAFAVPRGRAVAAVVAALIAQAVFSAVALR